MTPNETEAAALTGLPVDGVAAARAAADLLVARGAGGVVDHARGAGGAAARRRGRRSWCRRCAAGPVVETTGAGDAFNGGFAVGLAARHGAGRRGAARLRGRRHLGDAAGHRAVDADARRGRGGDAARLTALPCRLSFRATFRYHCDIIVGRPGISSGVKRCRTSIQRAEATPPGRWPEWPTAAVPGRWPGRCAAASSATPSTCATAPMSRRSPGWRRAPARRAAARGAAQEPRRYWTLPRQQGDEGTCGGQALGGADRPRAAARSATAAAPASAPGCSTRPPGSSTTRTSPRACRCAT